MCGAIRYSAEGKHTYRLKPGIPANHVIPVGPKVGARAICHCAQCQKVNDSLVCTHRLPNADNRYQRTSSAFSVNWIIPRKNFKITKGTYDRIRIQIDRANTSQARHAPTPTSETPASCTTTTSAATAALK